MNQRCMMKKILLSNNGYSVPYLHQLILIKTNEQYIKIFHKYMVNFSNRIMDTHIKMDEGNLSLSYDYIHNGLTMLISDFEMCDFIKFNKSN